MPRADAADAQGAASDSPSGIDAGISAVLDELRLDPAWSSLRAAAVCQALARRLADSVGSGPTADGLSRIRAEIWSERGVASEEDLRAWLSERHLTEERVRDLLRGDALRRWAEEQVGVSIPQDLIDQLQLSVDYPRLLARARDKQAQLAGRGLLNLPHALDATYQELLTWWARERPHLSPSRLAADGAMHPFGSDAHFLQAVINEYHYVTRCQPDAPTGTPSSRLADSDIATTPGPCSTGTASPWLSFGDLDQFGSDYWDRAPLHRTAPVGFDAAAIVSRKELDRLITSRHTNALLLERGVYVDRSRYREAVPARADGRTSLLNPAAVLSGFRSGKTIVIPSAHELSTSIDALTNELEQLFDASVDAALFVSPPGSLTDWHADPTHGVVLQLYGAKRWTVERDGRAGTAQLNSPLDVMLQPGDLLYVPRRFMHQVRADAGMSVHLTFSCSVRSWFDRTVEALAGRPSARDGWAQCSPPNADWGPASAARWREESRRRIDDLREAIQEADVHGADGPRVPTSRRRVVHTAAFLDACEAMTITATSTVRRRHALRVRMYEPPGTDTVVLEFNDRCVHFPRWLAPALRLLLTEGQPSLASPMLPLDPADALVLIRRLVAEGLLEHCSANVPES